MKSISSIFILFIISVFRSVAQPAKHVVLITIDGFRPDFYKEEKWGTPNMHQLINSGSYADGVRGVFPTVTYPSHTTIITGAMPIRHGIYYNTPFEADGETGKWYWQYSSIKIPNLWTAIHDAGLKSGAVSWPVTVGAPIDYNLPEFLYLDRRKDHISPMRDWATPKNLLELIEQNATGKLRQEDMNSDYMTFDENLARMASYIILNYKPAFIAIHLPCVDHAEHAQGREGELVSRAIAGADHSVGRILEAIKQAGIKDSTAVIVTGDHGFVDIHTAISPNIWLEQGGIKTVSESKSDWQARFHTSGGGAFLMLNHKSDKKLVVKVRTIFEHLPAGQRKLFRIIERTELDKIGADDNAPLALAATPGVNISDTVKGNAINAAHGGTHGFFPDFKEIETGFIISGAGITKGAVIPKMGLEDIAPLISKLLGLNYTSPDGVLYPGLFDGKQVNLDSYK